MLQHALSGSGHLKRARPTVMATRSEAPNAPGFKGWYLKLGSQRLELRDWNGCFSNTVIRRSRFPAAGRAGLGNRRLTARACSYSGRRGKWDSTASRVPFKTDRIGQASWRTPLSVTTAWNTEPRQGPIDLPARLSQPPSCLADERLLPGRTKSIVSLLGNFGKAFFG